MMCGSFSEKDCCSPRLSRPSSPATINDADMSRRKSGTNDKNGIDGAAAQQEEVDIYSNRLKSPPQLHQHQHQSQSQQQQQQPYQEVTPLPQHQQQHQQAQVDTSTAHQQHYYEENPQRHLIKNDNTQAGTPSGPPLFFLSYWDLPKELKSTTSRSRSRTSSNKNHDTSTQADIPNSTRPRSNSMIPSISTTPRETNNHNNNDGGHNEMKKSSSNTLQQMSTLSLSPPVMSQKRLSLTIIPQQDGNGTCQGRNATNARRSSSSKTTDQQDTNHVASEQQEQNDRRSSSF